MLTPIITGYGGPIVRADTLVLVGTGFGRVSSAALVNGDGDQYECEFIVNTGQSVTITVPRLIPDDTYVPVLGTLDNIPSQNMAGPLVVPTDVLVPPLPDPPPNPVPDTTSTAMLAIRKRVRGELGDYDEAFQASVQGDGFTRRFDLPVEVVELGGLSVVLTPEGGSLSSLASNAYSLDAKAGVITLPQPLADDAVLTVTGSHFQFFTDAELDDFIYSAALRHTHGAESMTIYRDLNGFKHFNFAAQTVDTLQPVEYRLVGLLATIEALGQIQTDAAYDINVVTSDGTSLPREDRFRNIGELIGIKQALYDNDSLALGVGLNRIEVFTVRRVSRTTGKLVPVYVDREYDDVRTPPLRVFAPRNKGLSGSGIAQPDPSGYYGGGGP